MSSSDRRHVRRSNGLDSGEASSSRTSSDSDETHRADSDTADPTTRAQKIVTLRTRQGSANRERASSSASTGEVHASRSQHQSPSPQKSAITEITSQTIYASFRGFAGGASASASLLGSTSILSGLFDRTLVRLDVWRDRGLDHMMPRVGAKAWKYIQNNATLWNEVTLSKLCFPWSILAFFDPDCLRNDEWELADVLDELALTFPNILVMRRFSALRTKGDRDILEIRLKRSFSNNEQFTNLARIFKDFIRSTASSLPESGLHVVPLGEPDTFWGKQKPVNYNDKALELVPSFDDFFSFFPELPNTEEHEDMPLATASKTRQKPMLFNGQSLLEAGLCVACRELLPATELLCVATGATVCCKSCHHKLFDHCNACLDAVHKPDAVHVSCKHIYCRDCVSDLFRSGTSTLADFPPQCCNQAVAIHDLVTFLPTDVVRRYIDLQQAKGKSGMIACANPKCRAREVLILPSLVQDDQALCQVCLEMTCTRCQDRKQNHKQDGSCRNLPDEAFFKLAKEKKWRACPKCKAMVSRSEGCNDMRCLCGQKFCYTCGATYQGGRTCSCPMTFEGRVPDQPAFEPLAITDAERRQRRELTDGLEEVIRRLLYQSFLAEAGNHNARTSLTHMNRELDAAGVLEYRSERFTRPAFWLRHMWLRIGAEGTWPEEQAHLVDFPLRWEGLLPQVTEIEFALACPHLDTSSNTGRRQPQRCQGCLKQQESSFSCLLCRSCFCRECLPQGCMVLGEHP